jgi:REP element-mobilizing transposase RayT
MVTPRSWVAPPGTGGTFHVISRCTRRAWLLHGDHAHRREWFCALAAELLAEFRIDLHAYALMANHVHLVLRPRPDLVAGLSDLQVAEAGHRVMPLRGGAGRSPLPPTAAVHQQLAEATAWQQEYRLRLCSLSWLLRCLKQRFAKRANVESACTGHFWESRFHSVPLLDLGAVVACMAYVDLNPFRAGVVSRPEEAAYTSLGARLGSVPLGQGEAALAAHLTPLAEVAPLGPWSGELPRCDLDLPTYHHLILAAVQRTTAPAIRAGSLTTSPSDWVTCMMAAGNFQGTAVGSPEHRQRFGALLGRSRIHDGTGLFG